MNSVIINISLIFLLLMPVQGFAVEQNVTYLVIGEDQLWQGEVELAESILVAAGVELTVAPGTRIKITGKELLIRVEGSLQAVGSEALPIEFVSPAGWRGIELYQSDGLNRFEHVQITAAATGLTSSLSRFVMKQNRFLDCETAIKLHRQTNPVIEESEFVGNQIAIDIGTRSQVKLYGNRFQDNATAVLASHNSSGDISDNHFVGNQQGVYLQHLFPGQLKKNVFAKNGAAILCDQTMASPLIDENQFVSNNQGIVCLLASKPRLRNNLFRDNQLALMNNQLGSPQVEKNLFQNNRIAIKSERRSAPRIARNQFESNDLALLCDYLSYPTVKQNNFIDNSLAVKLGDHQSSDMEKQGVSDEQVKKFLAASGKAGKMAIFTPASGIVDVSENWWGKELKETAPEIFFARRQAKWVLDDTSGERYLRDQIAFSPWLRQPVADAGLK